MKYIKSFNENMSMAKSIISKKIEGFDKLKNILSKNLGYIGKFTEYLMNENVPISDLELLYNDLLNLRSKGKSIDISNLKYEAVIDKIQEEMNDLSINSFMKKLPSEQKALAKELLSSDYNLLLQVSKKENLNILLKKISRYKTKNELKNALNIFGKDPINSREKILEYAEGSNSTHIIYQSEKLLIIRIDKIEDVQKLGSDTSWCILRKGNWNTYTNGRWQYILYDFDRDELEPEFKIGFTLNKDLTIHAAHDVLDRSVIELLNIIIQKNNINRNDLVYRKESEEIIVTKDTISNINSRTTLNTLAEYSESVSIELIPNLISKIIDLSTGVNMVSKRAEILGKLINKFFSNKEFVTSEDLLNLDSRLLKVFEKVRNFYSKTLKNKYVKSIPDFTLPANVIIASIDMWSDNDLVDYFSKSDMDFIEIPGRHILNSADELGFRRGWTKEYINILSDKINELRNNVDWEKLNPFYKNNFNKNYIILNYVAGNPEKVDNSTIKSLNNNSKMDLAFLIKEPIDLSESSYIRANQINKWAMELIIKKDYEIEVSLDGANAAERLANHLDGYKLKFKISKVYLEKAKSLLANKSPKSKLGEILSKFRKRPKAGDIVTSEDGLISIRILS
jgi:hypothetical protein